MAERADVNNREDTIRLHPPRGVFAERVAAARGARLTQQREERRGATPAEQAQRLKVEA